MQNLGDIKSDLKLSFKLPSEHNVFTKNLIKHILIFLCKSLIYNLLSRISRTLDGVTIPFSPIFQLADLNLSTIVSIVS